MRRLPRPPLALRTRRGRPALALPEVQHSRCLCADSGDSSVKVVASMRGLLMLESYLHELPTGRLMTVGDHKACVLFRQHGHYFATLLDQGETVSYDELRGADCTLTTEVLTIELPPTTEARDNQAFPLPPPVTRLARTPCAPRSTL
jgi:hypothetical protein